MSFIDEFVTPIINQWEEIYTYSNPNTLGENLKFDLTNITENDVVFLGFLDTRKSFEDDLNTISLLEIRQELYKLHYLNWEYNFIDLGDIYPGETFYDSLIALDLVLNELIEQNLKVIVFGGNTVINHSIYKVLNKTEFLHFTQISPVMGLENYNEKINESNFLTKILLENSCKIHQFTSVANQNFLNPPIFHDILSCLNFQSYRLGDLHNSLIDCEPLIRTSDFVNFDLNSIEFRGEIFSTNPQANGLYPLESCGLSRFFGSSEFLKIIHFSNYQNIKNTVVAPKMLAQIIWHFLDGNQLSKEIKENLSQKTKYSMLLDNEQLTFYKETFSYRWWMECVINQKTEEKIIIPCSEKDYLIALSGEIPELYWRVFKKFL